MSSTNEPVRPGMSHPPYPSYREASIDWLPRIPSHWTTERLKRLVDLRSGDAITADRIEDDGDYPVYGGNGRRGFTSSWTHDGDHVLIGRQGALCGNINYASGRFWASEHAIVATPRQPLETHWLGETLRAMNLNQYSLSAAQPGLSVEQVGRLRVPLPPEEERSAIAAFLDRETAKIDALVAEQERLIDLLKEKRQAVISHAVTNGIAPGVRMKDSGVPWLGWIPARWGTVQSRRLFSVRNERARASDQQLTASQKYGMILQSDFIEREGRRVVQIITGRDSLRHAEPNDFIISLRSFEGGLERCTLAGSVTFHYVVLVPDERIYGPFFAYLFKSSGYIQALRATANLIRDGQDLRYSHFVQVDLPLVPMNEQKEIATFLEETTAEIDALTQETHRSLDLLLERRAALIFAAVTGQIDVRGLAEAEVA